MTSRINPEGQCHRLSERRTKPNGLYLQRVQRERGFESTIHKNKRSNPPFTKTSRTKRGAFEFWLPMKRRAPRIEEAKYSTPRFSPKNTKTFTEEEVLTRRQIAKLESRSSNAGPVSIIRPRLGGSP